MSALFRRMLTSFVVRSATRLSEGNGPGTTGCRITIRDTAKTASTLSPNKKTGDAKTTERELDNLDGENGPSQSTLVEKQGRIGR